ncbi:MAG: hypothetical protein JWN72_1799, partial [Thermoleophilia bacterium]|nr:hypothetical protein [Thermoleophilia bacterium]
MRLLMPEEGRQPLLEAATSTTPWRWYRPAVWAFALATAILWCVGSAPVSVDNWSFVATLVVLGWVADLAAVRVQEGMPVSAAHFAAPFAVIAAGVPGGLAAAIACLVGRAVWNRRDWNSFDVAVNVVATSVAGAVWQLSVLLPGPSVVIPAVLTVTAYSATRSLVNLGWSQEARSRGIGIPSVTVSIGRLMLAAGLLFTPSIALLHADRTSLLGALVLLTLP